MCCPGLESVTYIIGDFVQREVFTNSIPNEMARLAPDTSCGVALFKQLECVS